MSKVAIITAASKGIGAGCAKALADADYRVVLLARSPDVHTFAAELGGVAHRGDITDPADLRKLVDLALQTYGRIDGVVINTGHPPKGDLLAISDEDWHTGLDLMLLSVVRLARLVVPVMQSQGGGALVNITAYGAAEPDTPFPVSSAIRASVSAFTRLFADRYAADNIRMNSILPGFIDTWDMDDATRARIPMRRAGRVEEVGQTTAFLLSDAAGYITGQNILIDGGLTHGV